MAENAVESEAVVEEDKVLLGEMLDDLDVMAADVQFLFQGVSDMAGVSVMAVAIEPTHCRLADDLVPLALDGPRRGDGADHLFWAGAGSPGFLFF
jgi:hypothetical protein